MRGHSGKISAGDPPPEPSNNRICWESPKLINKRCFRKVFIITRLSFHSSIWNLQERYYFVDTHLTLYLAGLCALTNVEIWIWPIKKTATHAQMSNTKDMRWLQIWCHHTIFWYFKKGNLHDIARSSDLDDTPDPKSERTNTFVYYVFMGLEIEIPDFPYLCK